MTLITPVESLDIHPNQKERNQQADFQDIESLFLLISAEIKSFYMVSYTVTKLYQSDRYFVSQKYSYPLEIVHVFSHYNLKFNVF